MEDCRRVSALVKGGAVRFPAGGPALRAARYLVRVRLKVEFTTEPFDLEEAPAHALAAREVIETAGLEAVDVGPFGNTAEGDGERVLAAVDALLRKGLAAGATRISLQVNVVGGDDGEGAG